MRLRDVLVLSILCGCSVMDEAREGIAGCRNPLNGCAASERCVEGHCTYECQFDTECRSGWCRKLQGEDVDVCFVE